jgi:hypothetical protein
MSEIDIGSETLENYQEQRPNRVRRVGDIGGAGVPLRAPTIQQYCIAPAS